jgi:cellulose 1,4-beta-cellobiosidase
MRQLFKQGDKTIVGGYLTDEITKTIKNKYNENNHFQTLGGFKRMGESFKRGQVLVISLWDDSSVNMLWLDSTFPKDSKQPGAKRGPCDPNRGGIWWIRQTYPNSQYTISNLEVRSLTPMSPSPASPQIPSGSPTQQTEFTFESGNVAIQCSKCTITT